MIIDYLLSLKCRVKSLYAFYVGAFILPLCVCRLGGVCVLLGRHLFLSL